MPRFSPIGTDINEYMRAESFLENMCLMNRKFSLVEVALKFVEHQYKNAVR